METISSLFSLTFIVFLNIVFGGGIFYMIFAKSHELESEIGKYEHMTNLRIELLTKKIISLESKNVVH